MGRYGVKEIVYTLQGEGVRAGRAAVFCRFAGCNLWSGQDADRATAECGFCDTDFVGTDGPGGGVFAGPAALAAAVAAAWPPAAAGVRPYVVFTGGEPVLQLDPALVAAVKERGFEVGVETNGTRALPPGIDWVTVSPKAGSRLVLRAGDELKLAYPQPGLLPEAVSDLAFSYFFLQPIDGPEREANTRQAVAYCLAHPQWRLSLQLHKLVGIA